MLGLLVVWCFKDLHARDTCYGMGGIKSLETSGILLIAVTCAFPLAWNPPVADTTVVLVPIRLIPVLGACDSLILSWLVIHVAFVLWVAICVRDCVFVLDFYPLFEWITEHFDVFYVWEAV